MLDKTPEYVTKYSCLLYSWKRQHNELLNARIKDLELGI